MTTAPPTNDQLIERLTSSDEAVRRKALFQLAKLLDIQAIPAIQKVAADDSSMEVRYLARKLLTLYAARKPESKALIGRGASDTGPVTASSEAGLAAENPAVRASSLRACAKKKDPGLLPAVLSRTGLDTEKKPREPVPEVRSLIPVVLAQLGGKSQVTSVAAFLADEDPRVRSNALAALQSIGDQSSWPQIVRCIQDPDHRVKTAALAALSKLGKVNLIQVCREMIEGSGRRYWEKDSAVFLLASCGQPDVAPLLESVLTDTTPGIAQKARRGLKRLASKGCEAAKVALETASELGIGEEAPDDFLKLESVGANEKGVALPGTVQPQQSSTDPVIELQDTQVQTSPLESEPPRQWIHLPRPPPPPPSGQTVTCPQCKSDVPAPASQSAVKLQCQACHARMLMTAFDTEPRLVGESTTPRPPSAATAPTTPVVETSKSSSPAPLMGGAVDVQTRAKLATFERRVAATLLDWAWGIPMGQLCSFAFIEWVQWLVAPVVILWFWASWGATPGKLIMKVRVVSAHDPGGVGLPIGMAVGRYLAYLLSSFPMGLGFLWILQDPRRQGWHDKLAGTLVIDVRSDTATEQFAHCAPQTADKSLPQSTQSPAPATWAVLEGQPPVIEPRTGSTSPPPPKPPDSHVTPTGDVKDSTLGGNRVTPQTTISGLAQLCLFCGGLLTLLWIGLGPFWAITVLVLSIFGVLLQSKSSGLWVGIGGFCLTLLGILLTSTFFGAIFGIPMLIVGIPLSIYGSIRYRSYQLEQLTSSIRDGIVQGSSSRSANTTRSCGSCGHRYADDLKFCGNCGAPIGPAAR